jgi:hypothetical protein
LLLLLLLWVGSWWQLVGVQEVALVELLSQLVVLVWIECLQEQLYLHE